jgi:hypothetical protein
MAGDEFSGARERASYRVRYPRGYPERMLPRVVLEPDTPATCEDWSETGVRIRLKPPRELAVDDVVRLILTPHESDAIEVEGTIVRIEESCYCVKLVPPALPWRLMLKEQRAILAWQATRVETIEEVEAKMSARRRIARDES